MREVSFDSTRPAAAMPGPDRVPLRTLRTLASDPPRFFTSMRDDYGPMVRLPMPGRIIHLVSDPHVVQDVLVGSSRDFGNDIIRGKGPDDREAPLAMLLGRGLLTSDGDLHRRQRRLIQPLFHHKRIAEYGASFADLAEQWTREWQDGQRVDVLKEVVGLTLAIVTQTIFDVSLGSAEAETIRTAMPRDDGPMRWALTPGGRILARLPIPSNIQFWRGRSALDTVIYRLIAQRKATGAQGTDLLSLLMQARDADTGEPMDDRQVRDEALTLIMAGHDTTANALAWAIHLLGRHPQALEALHAELDEVLGDRLPSVADLPRLRWTEAIFFESLRLYPPVWTVARRLKRERPIGGYLLPADAMVMMSPWVVHRDPQWWPDPERFAPERWVAAAPEGELPAGQLRGNALQAGRPKFTYFPFGGGPRQCIGNMFAQMEAVLVLATIGRRWRFAPVPGIRIAPQARIIVRPRPALPMTAHLR